MANLATAQQVADRLGRPLTPAETGRVNGVLGEAAAFAVAYLGGDPSVVDGVSVNVPADVSVVVSRMVARVFLQPDPPVGVESTSDTSGPFQFSTQYTPGSTSGGPWLAQSDKAILRRFRVGGGLGSVTGQSWQTGASRWVGT